MKKQGLLKGYEDNRYWDIKLSKSRFLIGGKDWLYNLCWHILTLIMLIPLLLFSKYYSAKLKMNIEKGKEKDNTRYYHLFSDIYPGCVYSPFTKGYELKLLRKCTMERPILEIGIGDGYLSSLFFSSREEKLTYGADLIYETIRSAVKYNHCENYLIMDALEIPLPDNSMGTIIMNNLMHHLPNRHLVLKEVLRVLKKKGRFIFTENLIGWGTFTWEQLLLRKLRLNSVADKVLIFKLNLFAQELLNDENYYEKRSRDMGFKIVESINFVSKSSMYLSSLFEFLNLKQGQPTRKEMKDWLAFFRLKDRITNYMNNIIEYCFAMDKELVHAEGYAYQFLIIEKAGGDNLSDVKTEAVQYVCPKCKGRLKIESDSFFCGDCAIGYRIIDGIPIFISYQDRLRGIQFLY